MVRTFREGFGLISDCNSMFVKAGVAQLVEHYPSKLDVASSSLVARSREYSDWEALQ